MRGMRVVPAARHASRTPPSTRRSCSARGSTASARMAHDHGKPQAQQLPARRRSSPRLASTLRRPPRWPSTSSPIRRCCALREAGRIDMAPACTRRGGGGRGARPSCPISCSAQAQPSSRRVVRVVGVGAAARRANSAAPRSDAPACCHVDARSAAADRAPRRRACRAGLGARPQPRSCRSKITPWRSAPLGRPSARRCRNWRAACTGCASAAGDHGRRSSFRPGRRGARRGRPRRQCSMHQASAAGVMPAVGDARRGQQLRHRAHRARGAERLAPVSRGETAPALPRARRRRPPAPRGSRVA